MADWKEADYAFCMMDDFGDAARIRCLGCGAVDFWIVHDHATECPECGLRYKLASIILVEDDSDEQAT